MFIKQEPATQAKIDGTYAILVTEDCTYTPGEIPSEAIDLTLDVASVKTDCTDYRYFFIDPTETGDYSITIGDMPGDGVHWDLNYCSVFYYTNSTGFYNYYQPLTALSGADVYKNGSFYQLNKSNKTSIVKLTFNASNSSGILIKLCKEKGSIDTDGFTVKISKYVTP